MIGVATDAGLVGEHCREAVGPVRPTGFEQHDMARPIFAQPRRQYRPRRPASDDQYVRALISLMRLHGLSLVRR